MLMQRLDYVRDEYANSHCESLLHAVNFLMSRRSLPANREVCCSWHSSAILHCIRFHSKNDCSIHQTLAQPLTDVPRSYWVALFCQIPGHFSKKVRLRFSSRLVLNHKSFSVLNASSKVWTVVFHCSSATCCNVSA